MILIIIANDTVLTFFFSIDVILTSILLLMVNDTS